MVTREKPEPVSRPVGERKLQSPEAAGAIDREVDELNVTLREISLKIHGKRNID